MTPLLIYFTLGRLERLFVTKESEQGEILQIKVQNFLIKK